MRIRINTARFKQTHWLFAIIALVFGILFMILTPPLWGPDEGAHFARSYQISTGNLTKEKVKINGQESYGGGLPQSLVSLNNLKDIDISNNQPGETRQVDSVREYSIIGGVSLTKDKVVVNPFGNLAYPTIAYIAPATGIFIANLFNPNITILPLVYVARLMTLVLYIGLTCVSLYIIRKSSFRWVLFVIALLPSTLYQASVVSVDPLITSLCFVLFSLIYLIAHTKKRIQYQHMASLAVVSILIAFLKPPYLLLILILPFLRINILTPRLDRLLIRIGIPVLSVLAALLVVSGLGSSPAMTPSGVNFAGQVHWIMYHQSSYIYMLLNSFLLIDWTPQVIGVFGSSFIFIPMPLVYILVSLLVITAFIKLGNDHDYENSTKLTPSLYIGVSLASATAIITTLFLAYTRVGASLVSGVQGRYFIPILVFLMYGIRFLIKSRIIVAEKSAHKFYPAVMALCLTISILWYYKILY